MKNKYDKNTHIFNRFYYNFFCIELKSFIKKTFNIKKLM